MSKELSNVSNIEFHCCFCDEPLAKGEIYSVVLVSPADEGQTWWCHRGCFGDALHPDYRYFSSDDIC